MDRRVPFARIVQHMMPFFVSRQIFTGAGKVGRREQRRAVRLPDLAARRFPRDRSGARDHALAPDHQHARRAPRRSREVPPAARHRRRRQHGARSRTTSRSATMAIVLSMVEDDFIDADFSLENPGGRLSRGVARPHAAARRIRLKDGRTHHRRRPPARVPGAGAPVLPRPRGTSPGCATSSPAGSRVLDRLAEDPDAARPRAGLGHQAPAHRKLHGQARPRVERFAGADDRPPVPRHPPGPGPLLQARGVRGGRPDGRPTTRSRRRSTTRPRTRARYFRGMCLQRYADEIVSASWDSVIFDLKEGPLKKIFMLEPLRGTEAHVRQLLTESPTASGSAAATSRAACRDVTMDERPAGARCSTTTPARASSTCSAASPRTWCRASVRPRPREFAEPVHGTDRHRQSATVTA